MALSTANLCAVCRHFKTIEDLCTLSLVCKKFRHVMGQLTSNPVPLTEKTIHYFTNLKDLHLYTPQDNTFGNYNVPESTPKTHTFNRIVVNYEVSFKTTKDLPDAVYTDIIYTKEDRQQYGSQLPKSTNSIGNLCYGGYKWLTKIDIPTRVTSIRYGSFWDCAALTAVTISHSIKEVGVSCFRGCEALREVVLPNSLTKLGGYSFRGCTALTKVDLPKYCFIIEDSTFAECSSLKVVVLKEETKEIGKDCFASCVELESLVIPKNVKKIGENCFYKCIKLTSISIPQGVESIGNGCFGECVELKSIKLPSSIQTDNLCFSEPVQIEKYE
ncbi:hypothetical protein EIN_213120 [Entamoeba invadens IP1]|uniref:Leucine rich repeat containing protein BspA family protein n=1 Tax=Entamoeba invadens IP1 TaxID=370355 RepID=A0A0A1TV15_ENTIV|nr:hypothetical protein EIN_213120 [Entamoeba invadens IP1]ELP84082.1 hypothetical protein EIN_213120 [Entamoeba invadens IP1]|eukprot:XP_004183428.1 hypothetical protein EIN_213120 [Entamoeba invadens IP1]